MFRIGPTRLKILAMILERPGYPPTIKEMTKKLGFASKHGVHEHLRALRKAGLVEFEDHTARTLVAKCRFIPESALDTLPEGG